MHDEHGSYERIEGINLRDLDPILHFRDLDPGPISRFPFFPSEEPSGSPSNSPFEKYFDSRITKLLDGLANSGEFRPHPTGIYHGTNLAALDLILDEGIMQPPVVLLRRGDLVSGELKATMDESGDSEQKGPKFMTRKTMLKMGMIEEDDPHLYSFGGAGDIFFDSASGALSYTPEDPSQKAIVGVNRKVLEFHGRKFIDTLTSAGSEGIIHEGPLDITMGATHLLVPESRVEEYRERASAKYLMTVFPIEQLVKK